MSTLTTNNEAEILSRVIAPEKSNLLPETSKMILAFDFTQQDRERMNQLADKARRGTLTVEEQAEIDCYERVGHFLSLLQSKARMSLKQSQEGS